MPTVVTLNQPVTDIPARVSTTYTILEIRFDPPTNEASIIVLSDALGSEPIRLRYPYGTPLHTLLMNDALAAIKAHTGAAGATVAST